MDKMDAGKRNRKGSEAAIKSTAAAAHCKLSVNHASGVRSWLENMMAAAAPPEPLAMFTLSPLYQHARVVHRVEHRRV
jgi:hypothetical protein